MYYIGVPLQLAADSSVILPIDSTNLPTTADLVEEYNLNEGRINSDLSDLDPFGSNTRKNEQFNQYILSIDFECIHNEIIAGNQSILLEVINESVDVFGQIQNLI